MEQHILIIGHGYVGSELAQRLSAGERTVSVANRSGDEQNPYPVFEADVSSLSSLEKLAADLPALPDAIVHCASSSRGGAEAYRAVFLDGIDHLQNVFPDKRILFTSSTSVYGQTDGSVVTEESPTEPDRETSQILVEAERKVADSGGIALRLAGIYGPGRSIYLQRILEGKAEIEAGETSRFLNQIHRTDIVAAIQHLIGTSGDDFQGRIFNAVDDTPMTQRECYERLAAYFEVPIPPESPPNTKRKRAWTNKIVDNSALKSTGWTPQFPSFFDALDDDPELIPSLREKVRDDAGSQS
ncbi:MAG: NAD-dependent epimerase/dehydratase family protein [Verrucomicrobiales bacterium]|nr:NAD-dependent epimerase/dehydratase family protein [Verrucomicrobiales bacterium]